MKVEVMCQGHPLIEHDPPASDHNDSLQERPKLIKAVSGAEFEIWFCFMEGYCLHSATSIEYNVSIDGGVIEQCHVLPRNELRLRGDTLAKKHWCRIVHGKATKENGQW